MIGKISPILFGIFILFSSSSVIIAQSPEAEKLVSEASLNTQKNAVADYTYQMHFVRRGKGSRKSRLYEVMLPSQFPEGKIYRHPLILIEENEQPLSYDRIKSNRDFAIKNLEQTESKMSAMSAGQESDKFNDSGYWTIGFDSAGKEKRSLRVDILKLLENSNFSNLSRKEIDGRKTAVIRFSPASKIKLENSLSYLGKIEGLIWIDERDKRITRIEGYALGDFARYASDPNAEKNGEIVFLFDQTRVPDGFWFPKKVRLNFSRHPEINNNAPFDTEFTFSKYQHFKALVSGFETNPKSK